MPSPAGGSPEPAAAERAPDGEPESRGGNVAIVHDYFTQHGGAERVVGELARLFPFAMVHTSVFDPDKTPALIGRSRLRATRLQWLRSRGLPLPLLAPVLPRTFRGLELDGANVVISSTSAFAHHVRAPAGAVHVAYCHTPPHFLWEAAEYFRGREGLGRLLRPGLDLLRRADEAAAREVDAYVANSRFTAERILRAYGRPATVIHPPVDTAAFTPVAERSGRFLIVARLRRHKRIDLALEAATRLGWPLDVIGDGPDEAYLRARSGPNIHFVGRLSDDEVGRAMARCTAVIVPGVEDFGLTMAEVQAAGRPPVAFARGGAMEIVRDGETGFLFGAQTVDSIAEAMIRARSILLDPAALVASAKRFDRAVFDAALLAFLARVRSESRLPVREAARSAQATGNPPADERSA